jgi:hypothetical protein
MEQEAPWDALVEALRQELQEKGDILRLLNAQTEALYRLQTEEVDRLEQEIRRQWDVVRQSCRHSEKIATTTGEGLGLPGESNAATLVNHFPEYVRPLLDALIGEVNRLERRMEEKQRENLSLRNRLAGYTPPRSELARKEY